LFPLAQVAHQGVRFSLPQSEWLKGKWIGFHKAPDRIVVPLSDTFFLLVRDDFVPRSLLMDKGRGFLPEEKRRLRASYPI
jgi:hypothetical protein